MKPVSKTLARKLANSLLHQNKEGASWRDLQKDYGVAAGTLNRFANSKGEWLPKDDDILKKLKIYRKPRRLTPKTIHNDDRGQSWTLYMRHLIKGMATPTPTELTN
jgi:hypothetical protein